MTAKELRRVFDTADETWMNADLEALVDNNPFLSIMFRGLLIHRIGGYTLNSWRTADQFATMLNWERWQTISAILATIAGYAIGDIATAIYHVDDAIIRRSSADITGNNKHKHAHKHDAPQAMQHNHANQACHSCTPTLHPYPTNHDGDTHPTNDTNGSHTASTKYDTPTDDTPTTNSHNSQPTSSTNCSATNSHGSDDPYDCQTKHANYG